MSHCGHKLVQTRIEPSCGVRVHNSLEFWLKPINMQGGGSCILIGSNWNSDKLCTRTPQLGSIWVLTSLCPQCHMSHMWTTVLYVGFMWIHHHLKPKGPFGCFAQKSLHKNKFSFCPLKKGQNERLGIWLFWLPNSWPKRSTKDYFDHHRPSDHHSSVW